MMKANTVANKYVRYWLPYVRFCNKFNEEQYIDEGIRVIIVFINSSIFSRLRQTGYLIRKIIDFMFSYFQQTKFGRYFMKIKLPTPPTIKTKF